MKVSNQQLGGAAFLALSLFYGYFSYDIYLFPGAEFEPFTPRTLPQFLAVLGSVISLLLIVLGGKDQKLRRLELNYKPVALLLAAIVGYGLLVSWIGFVVATIVFLACSFRLMGERNTKRAWLVASIFTLVFWALLTQALDIYLEPGALWHWLQA